MSLLQPGYLWALLGLIVPLAIHLLSRKEGKLIRMGSLRHIRETSSRQFRSIRLNELLLLALRSIVIGLIVLLMSGWFLNDLKDNRKWLILEPGVEVMPRVVSIRDSLRVAGYVERYLVNGFPELDASVAETTDLDYFTRIEELRALSVDSVVVVATNRVVGFNGSRMSLPLNFRWITIEPAAREFEVSRKVMNSDSLFLRVGKSTANNTSFSSYRVSRTKESASPGTPDTQTEIKQITAIKQIKEIMVASDEEFELDRRLLLAGLEAIRAEVPEVIQISAVAAASVQPNSSVEWLFWLSEKEPPTINGSIVRYQPDPGAPLLSQKGPGEYFLSGRLNSEVFINQNVTPTLMRMLFPGEAEWRRAKVSDVRSVDDRALWSNERTVGGAPVGATGNQASTRYLLIALLLFVVLERMVSYKRNQ